MLRKIATGVVLSAALLTPLAACGSSTDKTGGTAKPTASPSPKPAELLAAAVTKTKGINVKFDLGDDTDKMTGSYDATKKMSSVALAQDGENMQLVITEADLYMSGLKEMNGSTLHMVVSKIPAGNNMIVAADPLAGLALLSGVATVTSPSANFFQGTLDLNKAAGATPAAQKMFSAAIKAAGAKASELQFNAKVDAQGYLSEFSTTLPGLDTDGKDLVYQLKLSDFGAPVTVTVPTSKVIEAPDAVYNQ